jgi:putative holliday junction resolvase
MSRILAIDFGTRRTGLAATDEEQKFAFALTTVPTHRLHEYLKAWVAENNVAGFVVGEPKQMNNKASESAVHVEAFIRKLKKDYPEIPVFRMDERFTSSMASKSILDSGIKKKQRRDKSLVDMVSATIILQSWIEQQAFKKLN